MPRWRRWLRNGLLLTLILLLLAAGGGYLWLRQSLPVTAGEILVEGLSGPVSVTRDRHGVPHVEAASFTDALFAQGFVHAQDRLWQMEFQRRVGAGRLSELVGRQSLPVDRFMRLLGLYRLAEASLERLAPKSRAWLDAYAAGVNAFLDTQSGPLPPEFLLLGHDAIEPWTPADSIVWVKMMALDLSTNWRDELDRLRLQGRLDDAMIADLWPDYPGGAPVTLAGLADELQLESLAAALPEAPAPGIGSNAWVVDGSRSVGGAPLLANDPHLGLGTPGTWYLAHLKAPELELIGAGLPGVPGIVLGHNGEVAWGMTNTGPDTQDLFVERLDPADPRRYLTPEGSAAFALRDEVIRVKGGEAETLRVRTTRHGPVLSDLVPAGDALEAGHVLALAWTTLAPEDQGIQTLFGLSEATDWAGFLAAVRDHGSPQQNVHYADAAGHIGFVAPGRVPIRKAGDGRWPVPGWTGAHDWTGMIPFDALPQRLDPPSGTLFNANNRVVGEDYPYLLTADWEPAYRARRIAALLEAGGPFVLQDFAAMQADQQSLLAADILPLMLALTDEAPPSGERARVMVDALRAWDGVMAAGRPEPLIFAAWYRELARLIYQDEFGDLFSEFFAVRGPFMQRVLQTRQIWCDDVTTADIEERCAALAGRALDQALAFLDAQHGDDAGSWRWGEAHPARMAHRVLEGQPLLGDLFAIELPVGGDGSSIDVAHYRIGRSARPFTATQAASYRGLYDLADLDRSRFIAATGQSGHPLSPHFRDLALLWAAGETISMTRDPLEFGASGSRVLRLEPGSPE